MYSVAENRAIVSIQALYNISTTAPVVYMSCDSRPEAARSSNVNPASQEASNCKPNIGRDQNGTSRRWGPASDCDGPNGCVE